LLNKTHFLDGIVIKALVSSPISMYSLAFQTVLKGHMNIRTPSALGSKQKQVEGRGLLPWEQPPAVD